MNKVLASFPKSGYTWVRTFQQRYQEILAKGLSMFFDYPPQICKVIYTTNAIESVNASLRKVTKTRRSFPNAGSVMKVLYLALHHISRKWTMPIRDWKQAMSQFTILFGERIAQ